MARILAEIWRRWLARWIGGSFSQPGWARLAAATAAFTSSGVDSGTFAITFSVAGFSTSSVPLPEPFDHWPSM